MTKEKIWMLAAFVIGIEVGFAIAIIGQNNEKRRKSFCN